MFGVLVLLFYVFACFVRLGVFRWGGCGLGLVVCVLFLLLFCFFVGCCVWVCFVVFCFWGVVLRLLFGICGCLTFVVLGLDLSGLGCCDLGLSGFGCLCLGWLAFVILLLFFDLWLGDLDLRLVVCLGLVWGCCCFVVWVWVGLGVCVVVVWVWCCGCWVFRFVRGLCLFVGLFCWMFRLF